MSVLYMRHELDVLLEYVCTYYTVEVTKGFFRAVGVLAHTSRYRIAMRVCMKR